MKLTSFVYTMIEQLYILFFYTFNRKRLLGTVLYAMKISLQTVYMATMCLIHNAGHVYRLQTVYMATMCLIHYAGEYAMTTSKVGRVLTSRPEHRCVDQWRPTKLRGSLK